MRTKTLLLIFFHAYTSAFLKKKICPNDKTQFDSVLRKTIRIRDRLRKRALKSKKDYDWTKYKQIRNKLNSLKKNTLFKTITTTLKHTRTTVAKTNNRIFLKLLKDVFHSKRSNESPPMKCTYCNGKDSIAFSDTDKIDILNKYLYFISNISITTKSLPDFLKNWMILLMIF